MREKAPRCRGTVNLTVTRRARTASRPNLSEAGGVYRHRDATRKARRMRVPPSPRVPAADVLLLRPALFAEDLRSGIGPDADPIVAVGSIHRKSGGLAGRVADREEFVVA